MADGGQQFVGTVKSFNAAKGWGFIECEASKAVLGTDVFLMKSALGGYSANSGDQVSFAAHQGAKGAQASDVKLLSADVSYYGEVKTWNSAKGFGFITSPTAQAMYEKDIFVMKTAFGTAAGLVGPGAQLTFKVKSEDRGPVAHDVKLLQPPNMPLGVPQAQYAQPVQYAPARVASQYGPAARVPYGPPQPQRVPFVQRQVMRPPPPPRAVQASTWGPPNDAYAASAWRAPAPVQIVGGRSASGAVVMTRPVRGISENDVFFGTLKNLNAEKGWGHIDCQATNKVLGKDIFVMRTAFEGVNVSPGETVAFSVAQGAKGPHGTKLRVVSGFSPQMVFAGTCKIFKSDIGKGWGFLDSPTTQQIFGTDVFMHSKDLVQGTAVPAVGDSVQFTVDISNGRAVAKDVQSLGGGEAAASERYTPY